MTGRLSWPRSRPGFDQNKRDVVTCQYVDPAGVGVTIVGLRTPTK